MVSALQDSHRLMGAMYVQGTGPLHMPGVEIEMIRERIDLDSTM